MAPEVKGFAVGAALGIGAVVVAWVALKPKAIEAVQAEVAAEVGRMSSEPALRPLLSFVGSRVGAAVARGLDRSLPG